jgi:hypothetical protein
LTKAGVRKMNADNRKGELVELKNQLRQLAGSRAPGVEDVKRELYKKVISYMTIGIDVSSLFSEMVMCSATSDLVLKKMCYLYVGNYARGHPDLALLTINFLQKDCHDEDPMIRGLALRSLCSLRVMNLVEYLVGPLHAGLKDSNGYVRTVAAMGVLKLYHISPSSCTDNDFPAMLKTQLLQDSDAQVRNLSHMSCNPKFPVIQEVLPELLAASIRGFGIGISPLLICEICTYLKIGFLTHSIT